MSDSIKRRVSELGLTLPEPSVAVGNYATRLRIGNMLYISGQLPVINGKVMFTGSVHTMKDRRNAVDRRQSQKSETRQDRAPNDRRQDYENCTGSDAIKAAQFCALNIIAQIAAEVNDSYEQIDKIIRLGGFVNSAPTFTDQAKVINGASDLMVNVFGDDIGIHVRAATGASALPLNVPVEIEALVKLK